MTELNRKIAELKGWRYDEAFGAWMNDSLPLSQEHDQPDYEHSLDACRPLMDEMIADDEMLEINVCSNYYNEYRELDDGPLWRIFAQSVADLPALICQVWLNWKETK